MIESPNTHIIDDEYVEQIREYVSFYVKSLLYIKDLIKYFEPLSLEPDFQANMVKIIDRLTEILGNASQRLKLLKYPDNLEEAYRLENRIKLTEGIVHSLIDAFDKRSNGCSIEHVHFYLPSKSEHIGTKVYKAVDNLMNHFLLSFFPKKLAEETVALTLFGDEMGYRVLLVPQLLPLVAITCIPKVDMYRCRFWSCLGHETAHQKYPYVKLRGKYEDLRTEMTEDLIKLGTWIWQIALPRFAHLQFEEIICDLSSLILSGPPDLFSLLTLASNPRVEAQWFDRHPPLSVRVMYMFKYLENLEQNNNSLYRSMLNDFKASWKKVNSSISIPYRERRYIREYNELIEHYYSDLLDLSRAYLTSSRVFRVSDWEKANQLYESYKDGERLIECDLDFTTALNFIWIKRWRVFKGIHRDSHSPEKFIIWHEFERKLTDDIIELMASMRE